MDSPKRAAQIWVPVAIALIGWLVYWNAAPNEFVWDDVSSILLHEDVKDPAKVKLLFQRDQHHYGRGDGNFYRPLVSLTFMIDYWMAGGQPNHPGAAPDVDPFFFHLSSALWHIAAALCLWAVLYRAAAPSFVQITAPLLYVVHPLHTEAVAYISGRADSMAATFIFLGLWLGLSQRSRPLRIAEALAAALCCAGAVLSKESGMILPLILLLAAACRLRSTETKESTATRALYFLPALTSAVVLGVYAMLRTTTLNFGAGGGGNAAAPPITQRAAEAAQAFALYLKLILFPSDLHMERTLEAIPAFVTIAGFLALTLAFAIMATAWWKRSFGITLGMAIFLAAWFPISGLIPLNAPMAEHWLYVPLAGLLWAVCDLAWRIMPDSRSRAIAITVACALGLSFVYATVVRNQDWRNGATLFQATLKQNPDSLRVRYNHAVGLEMDGNLAGAQRHFQKVAAYYEDLHKSEGDSPLIYPQELETHLSLGNIYLELGQPESAFQHYNAVLSQARSESFFQYAAQAGLGMAKCLAIDQPTRGEAAIKSMAAQIPGIDVYGREILAGKTLTTRFD
jgi:hypothetical protein